MSKRDSEIIEYLRKLMNWTLTEGYTQIKTCFNIKRVPTDWYIHKRCHEDYHLLYIREGKGEYFIEGEHFPFRAGRILFLSYSTTHWGNQDLSYPPSIIPLRFQLHSNISNEQVKPFHSPFYFAYDPKDFSKFEKLFESIYRASCEEDDLLRSSISNAAILHLLGSLYTDMKLEKDDQNVHESIKRAKNLMDDNPSNHFSIECLAKEAQLSPKYFTKLFKQSFRLTPYQYQIKNRLAYARFLIENTDSSIKEIAFQLGYPDPYTFTKQFKKFTGIAPSKLRKIKYT